MLEEVGFEGEFVEFMDDIFIYYLKMCGLVLIEVISGLKKDYEEDFKIVILCVCGIIKD